MSDSTRISFSIKQWRKIAQACAKAGLKGEAQEIRQNLADLKDERVKMFVEAAQDMVEEGRLEVDDDAVVSFGEDPGAYVAAWLWVSNEDAGVEDEEEDEDEKEEDDE